VAHPSGLTPREREVVVLVANGLMRKEIARRLGLSPATIAQHVVRIYKKLEIHGIAQLTRYSIRQGWTIP
jgi:two-component system secretion response regulator SsrB